MLRNRATSLARSRGRQARGSGRHSAAPFGQAMLRNRASEAMRAAGLAPGSGGRSGPLRRRRGELTGRGLARQQDAERAAVVQLALGPDAPAMAGDDVFADIQAEPHPAGAPRHGIFRLIEEAEHGVELMW